MRKILLLFCCLILAVAVSCQAGRRPVPAVPAGTAPSVASSAEGAASPSPEVAAAPAPEALLGVWVPYFSLTPEQPTQAAFQANFRAIAAGARAKGLNALFVHVRPLCDALYPSAIFPWSHLLTGEQGKDPGWDPLAFMVAAEHFLMSSPAGASYSLFNFGPGYPVMFIGIFVYFLLAGPGKISLDYFIAAHFTENTDDEHVIDQA